MEASGLVNETETSCRRNIAANYTQSSLTRKHSFDTSTFCLKKWLFEYLLFLWVSLSMSEYLLEFSMNSGAAEL